MCNETLVELCEHEFADLVDELFQKNRENGYEFLRAPIIDRLYSTWDDEYIHKLKQLIRAALAVRKAFRQRGPPWAPLLPLSLDACMQMGRDESSRVNLVGLYAGSLLMLEYDYKTHPPFADYARGVMAYKHAPNHYNYLREDPELQQEFPPKPLAGIDAGLNWRTPEMIARSRAGSERAIQRLRDRNASEVTLKEWVDEHNSYFGSISV
jgi:hypothetical protein